MKQIKKRYLLIITIFLAIFVGVVGIFILKFGCKISKKEASLISEQFCRKVGVAFEQNISFDYSCPYHMLFIKSTLGKKYKEKTIGDRCIAFGNELYRINPQFKDVYIDIGCKSKEVELYINMKRSIELHKKYEALIKDSEDSHRIQPKIISEEKAQEIIQTIAAKLNMPDDLMFKGVHRSKKEYVWSGYWVRQKDGFQYENDGVAINIADDTGDFVSYEKTYRGTECSTKVNITKEEAIEIAWKKLLKHLPRNIEEQAKNVYHVKADIFITQPKTSQEKYWGYQFPSSIKKSKLAWVITFYFTGGLNEIANILAKPYEIRSDEENKIVKTYQHELSKRRRSIGKIENEFEIRIDAETGDVLYISQIVPWYLRWLVR